MGRSSWLFYMLLVCCRQIRARPPYWRASPSDIDNRRWSVAFVVGAAMAAAGWSAAAIVLYVQPGR